MDFVILAGCLKPCDGTCTDPRLKCAHPTCCNYYISCNTTLQVHRCDRRMIFRDGDCKGGNQWIHCVKRRFCKEAPVAIMCTTTTQSSPRTSSSSSHSATLSTRVLASTTGEQTERRGFTTSTPTGHGGHISTTELQGTFHVTTRIPTYTDKQSTTIDIHNITSVSTGYSGSSGPTSYTSSPTHQHTSTPSTTDTHNNTSVSTGDTGSSGPTSYSTTHQHTSTPSTIDTMHHQSSTMPPTEGSTSSTMADSGMTTPACIVQREL